MKLQRVIEILEKHQDWRRDQSVPAKTEMQSPIEIGTAIDYALRELKKLNLGSVNTSFEQVDKYARLQHFKGSRGFEFESYEEWSKNWC